MMKLFMPIIACLILFSCSSDGAVSENPNVSNSDGMPVAETEAAYTLKKAKTYRFHIPNVYTWNLNGPDIDTVLSSNYLSLNDGKFEAKFYLDTEGNEVLAINSQVAEKNCIQYFSTLLQFNEDQVPVNNFETYFPALSAYSFYTFGDKPLSQLEGDERTRFAGYSLDLSDSDSLGVQFMFCNEIDPANTKSLNDKGVKIYHYFVEL